MPSLGNAFAHLGIRGKLISFYNRYLFKIIRKDASCQEPGDTRTDDQGMLPTRTLLLCISGRQSHTNLLSFLKATLWVRTKIMNRAG